MTLLTLRVDRHEEDGFTLIELIVAMSVFITVVTIFSVTYLSLTGALTKQSGYVDAQAQSRQAFEQLDKQIRYADSVYAPTTVAGNEWIDWRVPVPTATGLTEQCYQWKASPAAGTLQYRTWTVPTSGGSVATPAWSGNYSGLVIGATPVFTTNPADLVAAPYLLPSPQPAATSGTVTSASLGLALIPQVGVAITVNRNSPSGTSSSATVFSALNATGTLATPTCASYVARS